MVSCVVHGICCSGGLGIWFLCFYVLDFDMLVVWVRISVLLVCCGIVDCYLGFFVVCRVLRVFALLLYVLVAISCVALLCVCFVFT